MKKLGILLLFLFIVAAVASVLWRKNRAIQPSLVITHVTLIDGTDSPPRPDSTVVIKNQEIAAIGSSSSMDIPRHSRVIDASGKFLIPGLCDMHVHLTGAGEPGGSREFILPLLVANGITTVRDMGAEVQKLMQLRKEIDAEKRLGPQMFFTGPYLDGDPPAYQPSIVVRNPVEAREAVHSLKAQGVDFIKVQSRLGREAYFAIAEECRKESIRFVGHVPDSVSAAEASNAGQTSVEHLTGVLLAVSSDEEELRRQQLAPEPPGRTPEKGLARSRAWQRRLLDTYSPEKEAELESKFVENHTWQVPTFPILVHFGFMTPRTDLAEDPRMVYVPRRLREIWEQGRKERMEHRTEADFNLLEEIVQRSLEIVGRMKSAGVGILAGTDIAAPNVFPGSSLHEDLVYLTRAGLTPREALAAATSEAARFLGRSAEQGTIEPGKRADLVLLDANPLEDIQNTQKIYAVVLRGKLLTREVLDSLLESARKSAANN